MIDPAQRLPVTHQAKLLELSRSSVYYRPEPTPQADLFAVRLMDTVSLA